MTRRCSTIPGPLLIIVLLAFLCGCGPEAAPNPTTQVGSETIGPEGGSVTSDGVALDVPSGAVDEDVEIKISIVDLDLPPGWEQLTPVYRFEPVGLQFDEPVVVEFEVDQAKIDGAAVLWSDDDGASWDPLASTRSNGRISTSVDHFSLGVAARPTNQGADAGMDAGFGDVEDGGTITDAGREDSGLSDTDGDSGTGDDSGADRDSGFSGDSGTDGGACTPWSCQQAGAQCGVTPDGCGGVIECGACASNDWCGGGGTAGQCGCDPLTCADIDATCGSPSDGCGGTLNCGTCTSPAECGAGGQPFRCGEKHCLGDWCWETPLPNGADLHDIQVLSGGEAIAVGTTGTVIHFDGDYWKLVEPPGTQNLNGVHAFSMSDIWVVGNYGRTFHFDGTDWTEHAVSVPQGQFGHFRGVWGAATDDMWAAGDLGIYHWDGTNWTPSMPGTVMNDVWGLSANDIWAVGDSGVIGHWDGSAWSPISSGATLAVTDVSGVATDDVWFSGNNGIFHWDGSAIQTVVGGPQAFGVYAAAADSIYLSGFAGRLSQFDGMTDIEIWRRLSPDINSIAGNGSDDVWTVGDGGFIAHWDGRYWTSPQFDVDLSFGPAWVSPSNEASVALRDGGHLAWGAGGWRFNPPTFSIRLGEVSRARDGSVWAIGYNQNNGDMTILRWDETTAQWESIRQLAAQFDGSQQIWARDADNALVVTEGDIERYDGTSWTQFNTGGLSVQLLGGNSLSELWAIGEDSAGAYALGLWDGVTWSFVDASAFGDEAISSLWGTSADDIWIVTGATTQDGGFSSTTLWQWDGTSLSEVTLPENTASASIFGTGSDDFWVVGSADSDAAKGLAHHFDGSSWTTAVTSGSDRLPSLTSTGADELWIFSEYPMRWDGTALRTVPGHAAPAYSLDDSTAVTPDSVWAVGYSSLFEWDGQSWIAHPVGGRSISGDASDHVWAVTSSDTAAKWNGSSWQSFNQGLSGVGLSEISVAGPNAIFARASQPYEWTGFSWSEVAIGITINADEIWAEAADTFWMCDFDTLYRYNNGTLENPNSWAGTAPNTNANARCGIIDGSGSSDVWVSGDLNSDLYWWNGTQWQKWSVPTQTTGRIREVAGDQSGHAWVADQYGIFYQTDANQALAPFWRFLDDEPDALLRTGVDDVWAIYYPRPNSGRAPMRVFRRR